MILTLAISNISSMFTLKHDELENIIRAIFGNAKISVSSASGGTIEIFLSDDEVSKYSQLLAAHKRSVMMKLAEKSFKNGEALITTLFRNTNRFVMRIADVFFNDSFCARNRAILFLVITNTKSELHKLYDIDAFMDACFPTIKFFTTTTLFNCNRMPFKLLAIDIEDYYTSNNKVIATRNLTNTFWITFNKCIFSFPKRIKNFYSVDHYFISLLAIPEVAKFVIDKYQAKLPAGIAELDDLITKLDGAEKEAALALQKFFILLAWSCAE